MLREGLIPQLACQKFAKVPVSPGEIEARDTIRNSHSYVKPNDHARPALLQTADPLDGAGFLHDLAVAFLIERRAAGRKLTQRMILAAH